ncbi:Uncharacterised protein [Amycolatopsis camponoti]|uniref:Uncharacterized protein n=1 Tax=Amycolatopsis camponoti TaxID=2606593 RepID=A0A6I8LZZ8_9PSEU|nr:hypothetical protein [Amycolatopsis camponoti]VVJ22704.1 Uncharacterised protein [Amycolatopsis camponoti]
MFATTHATPPANVDSVPDKTGRADAVTGRAAFFLGRGHRSNPIGLVSVGHRVAWNGHAATVCAGGALTPGPEPCELGTSAVSTLAASLATPVTVDGWHLWRHERHDRTPAQLRADLANE